MSKIQQSWVRNCAYAEWKFIPSKSVIVIVKKNSNENHTTWYHALIYHWYHALIYHAVLLILCFVCCITDQHHQNLSRDISSSEQSVLLTRQQLQLVHHNQWWHHQLYLILMVMWEQKLLIINLLNHPEPSRLVLYCLCLIFMGSYWSVITFWMVLDLTYCPRNKTHRHWARCL